MSPFLARQFSLVQSCHYPIHFKSEQLAPFFSYCQLAALTKHLNSIIHYQLDMDTLCTYSQNHRTTEWLMTIILWLRLEGNLKDHRIIEWLGIERISKITLFQPPCNGQGYHPLDQGAQELIKPGLECLHPVFKQPVPMLHTF